MGFTYGSLYISLIADSMLNAPDGPPMDFLTWKGIVTMFKHIDENGLLGAWMHYIIFDLWTANWISNDYVNNIEYTPLTKAYHVFSISLTLMFGPAGLFSYLVGKYTFLPAKNKGNNVDSDVITTANGSKRD